MAADYIDVVGSWIGFEFGDHIEHALGVTVGGIDHQHVDPGIDHGHGAFIAVAEEPYGTANQEAAFIVFGCVGEFFGLIEVFDGDEASSLLS